MRGRYDARVSPKILREPARGGSRMKADTSPDRPSESTAVDTSEAPVGCCAQRRSGDSFLADQRRAMHHATTAGRVGLYAMHASRVVPYHQVAERPLMAIHKLR